MCASMAASSLSIEPYQKGMLNPVQVVKQKFVGCVDIIAWCPVLDLLVVSMNKTSVWAYRLDGERVYSTNNKLEITAIAFRDDGQMFCVAGIDGSVKVYDSNDGHLLQVLKENFGAVATLLWDQHIVPPDDRLEGLFDVKIVDHMPRLAENNPTLENPDESGLNYMMIASESHANICFKGILTVMSLPSPSGILLVKQLKTSNVGNVYFLGRDATALFCIVHFSLHSDCTRLYHVIRILVQLAAACTTLDSQIDDLQGVIEPYFSFLDRALDNLRDSIGSKEDSRREIVNRLSEILLTGLIPSKLKDYWLNQLGERGIRRMSKLGNACYDTLRERISAHVIQALEKNLVLLNQLRGLTMWLRDSKDLCNYGISIDTLTLMVTNCQSLLGQLFAILRIINEEQQLFMSFVNWMKTEIVDKVSKEDDIDAYLVRPFPLGFTHSNVMTFVSSHLFSSKLYDFFDCASACDIITQTECPRSYELEIEQILRSKASMIEGFGKFYCSQLKPEIIQLPEFSSIDDFSIDLSYTPTEKSVVVAGHTNESITLVTSGPLSEKITVVVQLHGEEVVALASKADTALVVLIKSGNTFRVDMVNVQCTIEDSTLIDYSSCPRSTLLGNDEIQLENPKFLVLSHQKSSECLVFLQDADRRGYIVFKA